MNADPNARDKLLNDLSSTLSPASEPLTDTAPPPPSIPDHELIRRIGRGSYGEVWLARSALGTWRAVKIVHRAAFDHDRPYEREFEGIRRFEPVSRTHPSQLNVLHVGRNDAAGLFYYVMELADAAERSDGAMELRGDGPQVSAQPSDPPTLQYSSSYSPRTLRSDLYHRGRLPFEECLDIGLALATALDHLHRHGLVHRDIKPANIIFVKGIPKLADIGLVAQAEATLSLVGTEGYLPLEGPGTAQADIFSLGKVLYEMATGRDRQEFPELPTNLIEQPPAERAQLAELNEIIVRACHTDLKQRYQTAAELHADLALLKSGKSVSRMRAVERRLKFVARAGAVVTAVAVMTALAFFYQQIQTREARRLANENQTLAEAKSQLAADKSKLAEENREQLVRLHVANGVRLVDEGDPSAALLWFADALPLVTNLPAEEAIHRIRIQQVLQQTPRLLAVASSSNAVFSGGWSPDGKRFTVTTFTVPNGVSEWQAQLHNATDGHLLWTAELGIQGDVNQMKASREGDRLLIRSSDIARVLDLSTGKSLLPRLEPELEEVGFSANGRYLALAPSNRFIRVVSAVDGRLVAELRGHTNKVTSLSFSADGSLLASSSKDGTARLWRLPAGEPLGPPLVHDQPVRRAILSEDGSRLLTQVDPTKTNKECVIQMWQTQSGSRVGNPIRETNSVYVLAFCPGAGARFIVGADRHEIDVRDSASLERIYPPLKMGSVAWCLDFSPDGKTLAAGSDDCAAYVWNLETGEVLHPRFRHTSWVQSVHFSPDGKRLLTSGDDGTAKVWSLARESESAALTLPANFGATRFWDTIPRGRTPGAIPVNIKDGSFHLVDPDRLVEVASLKPQEPGAGLHVWSAGSTGHFWAVAEGKGETLDDASEAIDLWEQRSKGFNCLRLPHPKGVAFMTFAADDSRLVTFCRDWLVRVWRTSDGELQSTHPVPKNYYYGNVTVSQGGSYWFRPDGGAMLLYLDLKDEGKPGDPPSLHEQLFDPFKSRWIGTPFNPYQWGNINKMGFSPDGSRLAVVTTGQSGHIFDLRDGGQPSVHFKHGGNLLDLDWSPDGKRLLTVGFSPDVKLWDTTSGEMLLSPMRIGKQRALGGRWSADGRFIVTHSDDNMARVWDASTAEAVTPVFQHSGEIRWACVTPDSRLITASEPNLLRAWDLKPTALAPDVLVDYARLLSGRRLNASGALIPLKSDELERLYRSLRACAPQVFE